VPRGDRNLTETETHVEVSELADLRADFGIFADTKYRELAGAWQTGNVSSIISA
jgi:hypothetical protein